MNEKEKKAYLLLMQYWRAYEKKMEDDAKESLENLKKEFEKHKEEEEKIKMMYEHPEWFETTSPKEFGIKKLGKKKKR